MPAAIVWNRDAVMARVVIDGDGCWLWKRTQRDGYAMQTVRGRWVMAHRLVYELLVGPVGDGLTLDHRCHSEDSKCAGGQTCKHRACVNPDHLEPVTLATNTQRSVRARVEKCPKGHPYAGHNLIRYRRRRYCRRCMYARRDAARGRAA